MNLTTDTQNKWQSLKTHFHLTKLFKVSWQILSELTLTILRNNKTTFLSAFIINALIPCASFGQLSDLDRIVQKIQAQEINFPYPKPDTTIVVGTIDLNNGNPVITYRVPTYDTTYKIISPSNPPGPPPTIHEKGGIVFVKNSLLLNIQFNISNWNMSSNNFTVNLGTQSVTVQHGATFVKFFSITSNRPIITFKINGTSVNSTAAHPFIPALYIAYTSGAGVITLPALPVKIIYAPVVDSTNKKNTASISSTSAQNYTTSVSLGTTNTTSTTQLDGLQNIITVTKQIGDAGKALALFVPKISSANLTADVNALSAITGVLTDAIGSHTISTDISNSVTNQNTSSLTTSELLTIQAQSSNGGPGDGDVICYYTNAQLVWLFDQAKLKLSLIGYSPKLFLQSAKDLKAALVRLKSMPPGSKDSFCQLDSSTILSLLNLDPFTGPRGVNSSLSPTRFTIASDSLNIPASYQIGGASLSVSCMHQVQQTDNASSASMNTTTDVYKSGFLGYIGLGVSDDKTLKTVYTKNESSQYQTGQTITGTFQLNASGSDNYSCEVYFDKVFGTFAFRDDTQDLNPEFQVSGMVSEFSNGRESAIANLKVGLNIGGYSFWTVSNSKGQFKFRLPKSVKRGQFKLMANKVVTQINFTGQTINNINLKTTGSNF